MVAYDFQSFVTLGVKNLNEVKDLKGEVKDLKGVSRSSC